MSNSDDEYYILIGRVTLLVDRRTYMLAAVDISSRRESITSYRLGIYLVLYKEEQVVVMSKNYEQ